MEKRETVAGGSSSERCGRFIYINRILCRTETDDGSFRPSDVFGGGKSHGWHLRPCDRVSMATNTPLASGEKDEDGNCDAESVAGFACAQYVRQLLGMPSIAPVNPIPSPQESQQAGQNSPAVGEEGRLPLSSTVKLVSVNPLSKSEELSSLSNMAGVIDCPIANMFGVLSGGVIVGCSTAAQPANKGTASGTASHGALSAGEFVDFSDTTIVSTCTLQASGDRKTTTRTSRNKGLPQESTRQFINELLYRCKHADRIEAEALLSLHSSIEPFSGDGVKSQITPTLPYPVRPHVRSNIHRDMVSLLKKVDTSTRRKQVSKRDSAKKSVSSTQKRVQASVWSRFEPTVPSGVTVDVKLAINLEHFRLRRTLAAPQFVYQPSTIPFPLQLNGLSLAVDSNSVVEKLRSIPEQGNEATQTDLLAFFHHASLSARRESFGVYSGSNIQAWRQHQDSRDAMMKHQTFEKRLTSSLKCARAFRMNSTPGVSQDDEDDDEDDAAIAAFLRATKCSFDNVETWNLWKAFRKHFDNIGVLCAVDNWDEHEEQEGESSFTYVLPGALEGMGFKGYVDHFALTAAPPSKQEAAPSPSQSGSGVYTSWIEKQRIIADSWHYLLLAQPLALKERIEQVVKSCVAEST